MERLRLHAPVMIQDLPAGGQRLLQGADGFEAVIVGGEVVLQGDKLTGATPGRLVRAGS